MNECISLFSSSAAQPMNLGGKYKAHANLCNLHSGAVIFHENPNIILNRMISIDIAWTGAKFLDLRSSHHRHWGLFDKGIGEFRSELRGWEGTSPIITNIDTNFQWTISWWTPSSSWSPAWLQFTTLLHWSIDPLGPGQLCSHPGYLGVARPLQLHLLLHLPYYTAPLSAATLHPPGASCCQVRPPRLK